MKIIIQFILFIFISLFLDTQRSIAQEKIKIGLIVPLSGEYKEIGRSIVNSTRFAINKIDNSKIEILPRDTKSNPEITLRVAKELHELGVKIIIGPVFNKNLIYLEELNEVIFLSLTNKITNNPKNYIFSALTASIDGKVEFKPHKVNGNDSDIGELIISGDAQFFSKFG